MSDRVLSMATSLHDRCFERLKTSLCTGTGMKEIKEAEGS